MEGLSVVDLSPAVVVHLFLYISSEHLLFLEKTFPPLSGALRDALKILFVKVYRVPLPGERYYSWSEQYHHFSQIRGGKIPLRGLERKFQLSYYALDCAHSFHKIDDDTMEVLVYAGTPPLLEKAYEICEKRDLTRKIVQSNHTSPLTLKWLLDTTTLDQTYWEIFLPRKLISSDLLPHALERVPEKFRKRFHKSLYTAALRLLHTDQGASFERLVEIIDLGPYIAEITNKRRLYACPTSTLHYLLEKWGYYYEEGSLGKDVNSPIYQYTFEDLQILKKHDRLNLVNIPEILLQIVWREDVETIVNSLFFYIDLVGPTKVAEELERVNYFSHLVSEGVIRREPEFVSWMLLNYRDFLSLTKIQELRRSCNNATILCVLDEIVKVKT